MAVRVAFNSKSGWLGKKELITWTVAGFLWHAGIRGTSYPVTESTSVYLDQ